MIRRGTVVVPTFESRALKGNALGDPHVRRLPVYLPPSYGARGRRFPTVYFLTGFTGIGEMMLNRNAWSETIAERCDRLISERRMEEAVVVLPDCFTDLGGSQYLNSTATGRYEDYVVREIVSWIDDEFRTVDAPSARAVMGKSSGGYGSLVLGMRHPDVFGVVCCTSGDMYFPYCYGPDFPKALNVFARHGGTAASFLKAWRKMHRRNEGSLFPALNTLAMASCYSPNPRAPLGFDLPFHERTGELRADVWRRWLRWDPVEMVRRYAKPLKGLSALFLDCGTRDEFQLHHGLRIFHDRARRLGIPHRVEWFDDGHMNIGYRNDRSLEVASAAFRRGRLRGS